MAETVDNSLLLSVLKDIRKDLADQRTLLLSVVEYMRRMEQRLDARITSIRDELGGRITATRDDLELVIKSELMGRLTNFETRMEQRSWSEPSPEPAAAIEEEEFRCALFSSLPLSC